MSSGEQRPPGARHPATARDCNHAGPRSLLKTRFSSSVLPLGALAGTPLTRTPRRASCLRRVRDRRTLTALWAASSGDVVSRWPRQSRPCCVRQDAGWLTEGRGRLSSVSRTARPARRVPPSGEHSSPASRSLRSRALRVLTAPVGRAAHSVRRSHRGAPSGHAARRSRPTSPGMRRPRVRPAAVPG